MPYHAKLIKDGKIVIPAELRPFTRHLGLSFGDRACLALGHFTKCPILTADKDWSKLDLEFDIRQIR